MGFYTDINRVGSSISELDVQSTYIGEAGATQAMIESVRNEHLMFEYAINSDAREITLIAEGGIAEDIIRESAEGFFAKAKEYIKKIWEKVKAIIRSFITLIQTVFIRDNKALVKKFEIEVKKKDLSKMKYKWSAVKDKKDEALHDTKYNYADSIQNIADDARRVVENKNDTIDDTSDENISYIRSAEAKEKYIKDSFELDVDNMFDSFKDAYYDDSSEEEGLSTALLNNIISVLTNSKETIKNMEKAEREVDMNYKQAIKRQEDIIKNKNMQNAHQKAKKSLAVEEVARDIASSVISTEIQVTKWKIKECRAVFAKAARYNPKLVREDVELEKAYDEIEHNLVDEIFEGIYI